MSEDMFALNAQVQAIIERAKEQAKGYRDGSFRDNAMQVIVELDSRLQQAQQRENERIAQAVAAERARIVERLEAQPCEEREYTWGYSAGQENFKLLAIKIAKGE